MSVASGDLAERPGDFSAARRRRIEPVRSLCNHLAHAQDVVSQDWAPIAWTTRRLAEIVAPA